MSKKKIEPVISLGKDTDKLTIQKSQPIYALWRSELTLAEFKILDTYLGRINSHKPDERKVIFTKGELEEKLGVTKISRENLEIRLKHLMGNVVKVPDKDTKRGFCYITLFEEVCAEQDDDGQWTVTLECTQKSMKYFFNIEKLGYFRYKLRCITSITSRYTYIMFLYLENHRNMGLIWQEDLQNLKEILGCSEEEYAKEYKYFNRDVLKRVQKEIYEKTECRYKYEPIKKGRKVVAIQFTLETLSENSLLDENYEPIALEVSEKEDKEIEYGGELANLLGTSACNDEFTVEEIRVIQDLVLQVKGHNHEDCCDYLIEQVHKMNLYDNRKKIKNRFAYLCKMIEKDINKN